MFTAIKNLYSHNMITKDGIKKYVDKGLITAEQYEEITGEPMTD